MSGTETVPSPDAATGERGETTGRERHLERICEVLCGEIPFEGLAAMATALEPVDEEPPDRDRIAFCLDAETILNAHRDLDVVDYLAMEHEGLVVMPAQAVQDFWQHTESAVEVAGRIKDAYEALVKHLDEFDPEHEKFKEAFDKALKSFERSASQSWSADFRARVAGPLAALAERAVEPRFPKSRLSAAAAERTVTATPPGAVSGNRAALYVWAEFALGLLEGQDAGYEHDLVVLVTENKVGDWGVDQAHPMLVAEMQELTGARFEIWSFEDLQKFAAKATT